MNNTKLQAPTVYTHVPLVHVASQSLK